MKRVNETGCKPLPEIGRLRTGLLPGRLFVLLLLLVAGSCTQTEVEENQIPSHALKDVDAGFNLNVLANQTPATRSITFTAAGTIETDTLVGGANDTVRTRASAPLSEVQESQIASLWVGQYDVTSGVRLFSQYISSMTDNKVNMKLKQSETKSRVWFVANAGDLGEVATEKALKERLVPHTSTGEGLPGDRLCKMTGTWEGMVQAGGVKEVTVNLKRLLAKITFTYSMGDDFVFTPTSVTLKNAPSASQLEAPTGQLTAGITYSDYTGTASNTGATVYWYLPENMAGTVSGSEAVDSDKKKVGTGVTHATCIELTGTAVQGGVTYKNVTIRFYPGSDYNNYDIIRNSHYTLTVKLVGIDVSDERITVGEIPPIVVDPTEIPAKKGGEKELQITARPGQPWEFDMPVWLSALLEGKEIPSEATIKHQGPADIVFKAASANPKAEKRSVSFTIDVNGVDQEITITQSGSTLTKGSDVSLGATADSEGSSSFTATEGLPWLAALSGGDGWLSWSATNPGTSGSEAPAGAQALQVKADASNPFAYPRTATILVKAGTSVGDAAYTGLKQEIGVEQAGSTVEGSIINNIAAQGVTNSQSSFKATAGLPWAADVISGSWLTLTGGASGGSTTGAAQKITFDVAVNPSSSVRTGEITVHAGDAGAGPTGKITVTQDASELTASINPTTALAATKDASGTYTLNGTRGLPYSFTAGFPVWLTVTDGTASTSGGTTTSSNQTLTYKTASVNPNGAERSTTVVVKAGYISKEVEIKQSASVFTVDKTEIELENTETSGTVTVKGTDGLPWTVSPAVETSGITPDITTSTADGTDKTLTFSATKNTGGARSATFTIAVTGGDHTKTVEVTQKSVLATVTIDQALATAYKNTGVNLSYYAPFNYDNGKVTGSSGSDYKGTSSTCTISTPYTIEVEATQSTSTYVYNNSAAKNYCTAKGTGWRLPTEIELFAMWTKCKGSNDDATDTEAASTSLGAKFISDWYWSSSCSRGASTERCVHHFGLSSFHIGGDGTYANLYVRCVRE